MSDPPVLRVSTPGELEIVVARDFRAPRQLVFDAYTKPELLRRWFGPHGYTLVVCEIDLRVDGHWCYVVRGSDGSDMTLQGYFREIVRPEILVTTQTFDEGEYIADNASLCTTTFLERDGITTLTTTVRYATPELRDEMARSGMADGMGSGYERLEDLLATMTD